jgi:hypothetical protein
LFFLIIDNSGPDCNPYWRFQIHRGAMGKSCLALSEVGGKEI